jgi:hypothetical protein
MEDNPVKRLAEVAAAYGADSSRWPADERARLRDLASANPEILAEALEIDRLLSLVTAPPEASSARSRFVGRLNNEKQLSRAKVVPLGRRHTYSPGWSIAVAALAAALACGVYLGSLDLANDLFDPGATASDDPVDLAGLGDVSDYIGEDRS